MYPGVGTKRPDGSHRVGCARCPAPALRRRGSAALTRSAAQQTSHGGGEAAPQRRGSRLVAARPRGNLVFVIVRRGLLVSVDVRLRLRSGDDRRLRRDLGLNHRRQLYTRSVVVPQEAHPFQAAKAAYGPTTFGVFSCSKATNEVNFAAQKFSRAVLGSNNIDSCNRT
jgi:hypothetical protein